MVIAVNYENLVKANEYYKTYGFKYIDVDWSVSENILNITKPEHTTDLLFVWDKVLVASAEQSFLQMIKDKQLSTGLYMTITPCFRLCDTQEDGIHLPYFMKHELIFIPENKPTDYSECLLFADTMVGVSMKFFEKILPRDELHIVKTDIGTDILFRDIELGSYGARSFPGVGSWAYGTGCAEPRLSYCVKLYGQVNNSKQEGY